LTFPLIDTTASTSMSETLTDAARCSGGKSKKIARLLTPKATATALMQAKLARAETDPSQAT
jgi:hypothetical protein